MIYVNTDSASVCTIFVIDRYCCIAQLQLRTKHAIMRYTKKRKRISMQLSTEMCLYSQQPFPKWNSVSTLEYLQQDRNATIPLGMLIVGWVIVRFTLTIYTSYTLTIKYGGVYNDVLTDN